MATALAVPSSAWSTRSGVVSLTEAAANAGSIADLEQTDEDVVEWQPEVKACN